MWTKLSVASPSCSVPLPSSFHSSSSIRSALINRQSLHLFCHSLRPFALFPINPAPSSPGATLRAAHRTTAATSFAVNVDLSHSAWRSLSVAHQFAAVCIIVSLRPIGVPLPLQKASPHIVSLRYLLRYSFVARVPLACPCRLCLHHRGVPPHPVLTAGAAIRCSSRPLLALSVFCFCFLVSRHPLHRLLPPPHHRFVPFVAPCLFRTLPPPSFHSFSPRAVPCTPLPHAHNDRARMHRRLSRFVGCFALRCSYHLISLVVPHPAAVVPFVISPSPTTPSLPAHVLLAMLCATVHRPTRLSAL